MWFRLACQKRPEKPSSSSREALEPLTRRTSQTVRDTAHGEFLLCGLVEDGFVLLKRKHVSFPETRGVAGLAFLVSVVV